MEPNFREQENDAIASWCNTPDDWKNTTGIRSTFTMFDSGSKCTATTADDSSTNGYWSSSSFSSIISGSTKGQTSVREIDSILMASSTSSRQNCESSTSKLAHDKSNASRQEKQKIEIQVFHSNRIVPKTLRDHCAKSEGSYWSEPTSGRRRRTATSRFGCFASSSSMANEKAASTGVFSPRYTGSLSDEDKGSTTKRIKIAHHKYNQRVTKVYFHEQLYDHKGAETSCTEPKNKRRRLLPGANQDDITKIPRKNNVVKKLAIPSSNNNSSNAKNGTPKIKEKRGRSSMWCWNDTHCGIESISVDENSKLNTKLTDQIYETFKDDYNRYLTNNRMHLTEPPERQRCCSEQLAARATKMTKMPKIRSKTAHKSNIHTRNTIKIDNVSYIDTNKRMDLHHGEAKIRKDPTGLSELSGREMKTTNNFTTVGCTPITRDVGYNTKIFYKATEGFKQPIYPYALDLISTVCNHSYVAIDSDQCELKRGTKTCHQDHYQQVHRILDKPLSGYTAETEPEKERLMRLHLQQRLAAATSTGMSPIEFSRKLLHFWGGTLGRYETTVVADSGNDFS